MCKNAKVTFCNFSFFENSKKIFTFLQMRLGVYFTDVCGGSERSKRAKSPKSLHFTTWRSEMTQVLQPLCFPRSNQWFWDSKTHFGAQNAFRRNFTTSGAEKRARGRCCVRGFAGAANYAHFERRSAPWEHLGHFGSQWSPGLAGWLLGAQSRGLRAHG